MKSRGVVGKRIVRIEQTRIYRDDSDKAEFVGVGVLAIILEDGTRLEPDTMETGHGYATDIYVRKPKKV